MIDGKEGKHSRSHEDVHMPSIGRLELTTYGKDPSPARLGTLRTSSGPQGNRKSEIGLGRQGRLP